MLSSFFSVTESPNLSACVNVVPFTLMSLEFIFTVGDSITTPSTVLLITESPATFSTVLLATDCSIHSSFFLTYTLSSTGFLLTVSANAVFMLDISTPTFVANCNTSSLSKLMSDLFSEID